MDAKRLISRDNLATWAAEERAAGRRIVFTNGCYDLIHPGHLALLEWCKSLGETVLVAINDDASVHRLKGEGRPVYPAAERSEILLALRWVDAVTVFAEDTPIETITPVIPDVLVKGAEYGAGEIVGEPFVVANGGRVARFPMKKGFATSRIVARMRGDEDDS